MQATDHQYDGTRRGGDPAQPGPGTDRLAAAKTFDAVFGKSVQQFWGGGVQVAFHSGLFVEVAASRRR